VIVGDGPDRDALMRLARDAGVADRVDFRGSLPPAEVRALLGTAHLGLQPSRVGPDGDREGSPTVILEMQARGIDVVATDHADIPFIVPEPGRLVAEGDPEALGEELVRRATMSSTERAIALEAGRALVARQHDARRIATQLRDLYATVIGG
jgi:glycosyltransferase involved in cell wall biosynthesis